MALDMPLYLQNMRKYLENRQRYPLDELAKYAGGWIAWSPDGTRIVASAKNPEDVVEQVRAAGEDPLNCIVEGIPEGESMIGGSLDAGAL
jgi:hypothetical protein